MKLTVVFEDKTIRTQYANNHIEDFRFIANSAQINAFTQAVSDAGHNLNDYWAIQYSGGNQEIEFANGHPNTTVSGNSGLSVYTTALTTWRKAQEKLEHQATVPTWDDIRDQRDTKLLASDAIISWSTETGNTVPSAWTTYRQELRDITTTFGANTGNTELVVWPSKPSWPSA